MKFRRRWVAAATALVVFTPATVALPASKGADIQVSGSTSTGSPDAGAPFADTFEVRNIHDSRRRPRPRLTCHFALPSGQRTLDGVVMLKDRDRRGMFQNFQFLENGVSYTVTTNFYDGRAPLTRVVNLACKQSPVQSIQVADFVYVTGTVGSAMVSGSTKKRPVIHARVVQVLTLKDRGA